MNKPIKPTKEQVITSQRFKYLKHMAELVGVKVSLCRGECGKNRDPELIEVTCVHMRDFEFVTFASALKFIEDCGREIVHAPEDRDSNNPNLEVL